jgi:hypothetical protein
LQAFAAVEAQGPLGHHIPAAMTRVDLVKIIIG